MKMFFKCTLSALAITAMVVLALLSGGCNKDPENPSSDSIIGTWQMEFYEEEFGGDCIAEYSFMTDGVGEFCLSAADEQLKFPMLWRTEGNKLYITFNESLIASSDQEWDKVVYKVNGTTLMFDKDGDVTVFTKK